MKILIRKSIGASALIMMGVVVLLTGSPIGPFLFAFGLLNVCYFDFYLFTGKCGYVIDNKEWKKLFFILLVNLAAGWILGALIGITNPMLFAAAALKVASWTNPLLHFIQSILCGAIMFLAVETYKRKSVLGILYGVPLFIICGFQHCIANIITLGLSISFSPFILIAIVGNFLGAITMNYLSRD